MEYGGSPDVNPPAPEDEENIIAALMQFDRVISIHLTLTKSLLKKLSSIVGQFSELEDLVLLSQRGRLLTAPRTFLWGPHLRKLHLTRVAFSAPLRLLSSSRDLVDIHLHDFEYRHLSPKVLAEALSGMAHLQSLSLNVLSTSNHTTIPPLSEKCVENRVVVPSLSCVKYLGTSKYLDSLLARLDAPRLADIEITLFNGPQFEVSNLSKFIDRTEMWKLHRQADILFSERSVAISLTHLPTPTRLKFQVLCDQLRERILSIVRFCNYFPTFHVWVKELRVEARRLSHWRYNVDCDTWAMFIRSFETAKCLHLAGDISIEIVRALRLLDDRRATLLPVLPKLCICRPGSRYPPLREAVVSLMVDCRLSGRPIEVEYE
jgi:hypothetical protein